MCAKILLFTIIYNDWEKQNNQTEVEADSKTSMTRVMPFTSVLLNAVCGHTKFSWICADFFKKSRKLNNLCIDYLENYPRAASRPKIKRLLDGGGTNYRGGGAPEENFFQHSAQIVRFYAISRVPTKILFFFKN